MRMKKLLLVVTVLSVLIGLVALALPASPDVSADFGGGGDNKKSTTTTLSSSANPSTYGDSVTFTATVTKSGGSGTPSGTVTFKDGGTTIGSGSLSGSSGTATATCSTSSLSVGSHTITAAYGGDSNFKSSSGTCLQTVNKADATITVNGYTGTYDGNAHGATLVSATGVNGEDLSASVTLGDKFTNVAGGTAHWTFSNSNYNGQNGDAAIVINKASQTITFGALDTKTVGDSDFKPGASASSGLTVSYTSSDTSVATIVSSGTKIHIVGAGTSTITASQVGNGNYDAATPVGQTLTVNSKPTITTTSLPDGTVGVPYSYTLWKPPAAHPPTHGL